MRDLRSASDGELVVFLKDGDHAAFTEIYNRYSVPVLYQINQMLRNRESARDLLQDLFVVLWKKPENIKVDANLRAYLYVAARNRVFDLIEKGKVRNDYLSAVAHYVSEVSLETLNEIDERELSRIIQREIDLLPAKMKEVFELSRKENLSHLEIARKLGISDKTVKKQINKALHVLRGKVGPYTSTGLIVMSMYNDLASPFPYVEVPQKNYFHNSVLPTG
jgi:RNA polymerase sigma-70 factor (family 1)